MTLLLICSCNPQVKYHSNVVQSKEGLTSKITYLFFTVENLNGNPLVKLSEKKSISGKTSLENFDERKSNDDYYKISLIGKENQLVKTFYLDNPLAPTMETYSEEGINKEKGKLEKASFFIKFNEDIDSPVTAIEISSLNQEKTHILYKKSI